eukprot:7692816-Pyramimonas_sp.AAC.1
MRMLRAPMRVLRAPTWMLRATVRMLRGHIPPPDTPFRHQAAGSLVQLELYLILRADNVGRVGLLRRGWGSKCGGGGSGSGGSRCSRGGGGGEVGSGEE